MKRPKFSLAHKIALLLINAGVILALLCMYFRSRDPGSLWTGAVALLILPVLAGVAIARRSIVCPHCGKHNFTDITAAHSCSRDGLQAFSCRSVVPRVRKN